MYVADQEHLYSEMFEAIGRQDLLEKFQSFFVSAESARGESSLDTYLEKVSEKEQNGDILHLPRPRYNIGKDEVVFGEIVRETVVVRCMFTLVNQSVRNFIIDKLLMT